MSNAKSKEEITVSINEYLNEYIRYADTKVAFAFTIIAVLMAAVFQKDVDWYKQLALDWRCPSAIGILSWGFLLGCALTLAFGIWAVYPRTSRKPVKGLIFWENIAEYADAKDYRQSYLSETDDALVQRLVDQNYYLAKTACAKYSALRVLLVSAGISALLGVLVLILVPNMT